MQRSPGERLCVLDVVFQSAMVTAGPHWSEERRMACGPLVGSLVKALKIADLAWSLPPSQQCLQSRILRVLAFEMMKKKDSDT